MDHTSIYEQVLGAAFGNLAPALRQLHSSNQRQFSGVLTVRTGTHPLARFSIWLACLPRAQSEAACRLCLVPTRRGEGWQREIGQWKFITHQQPEFPEGSLHGEIRERFGPITLGLHLRVQGQSLRIRSIKTRILGMPLPVRLGIRVFAHETPVDNDSFCCNVRMYLPGMRPLLRYRGTLSKPRQGYQPCLLAKSQELRAKSYR